LPPRAHIEEDLDLAGLRERAWFKEFLTSLEGDGRHAAAR
jgi:hypothetical protein